MYSKLPDEFVDFLVSNDALQRYRLQLSPISLDKDYWPGIMKGFWGILIREAFWWKDTIEGTHYWETLHGKWIDYLRSQHNVSTGCINQVSGK